MITDFTYTSPYLKALQEYLGKLGARRIDWTYDIFVGLKFTVYKDTPAGWQEIDLSPAEDHVVTQCLLAEIQIRQNEELCKFSGTCWELDIDYQPAKFFWHELIMPIEPTKEMLDEAKDVVSQYTGTSFEDIIDDRVTSLMFHHFGLHPKQAKDVLQLARAELS